MGSQLELEEIEYEDDNITQEKSDTKKDVFSKDTIEVIENKIIKNRKDSYKIIKYLKENTENMYLNIEEILSKEEYEGNPKNDITVLLGYLRKKINISSSEYINLEKELALEPSKINEVLEKFIRMINEYILKENNSTDEDSDKDISSFIRKKVEIKISKNTMKSYILKNADDVYYWSDEIKEEEKKIIKKTHIINYWGKNYSLYYENFEEFEKMLIKEKVLKYIEIKYYKNEQRIKDYIEKLQDSDIKTNILKELEKTIYNLKLYHLDNKDYYEII